jgi:pyrroline-5-carboxylate reductase
MVCKLGVIGAGTVGEALARGVVARGLLRRDEILLSVKSERHRAELEARSGIRTLVDNRVVAREADTIIVAVKPKNVAEVLAEIGPVVCPGTGAAATDAACGGAAPGARGLPRLIVSTAAGVTLEFLESVLPAGTPVIRAMPNMAVGIGEGMTVLSQGKAVATERLDWALEIFRSCGRAIVLEEQYMDAVTGLSGSGPAYVYVIIESLADGGLKLGLPRDVATELAAQTVLGAARNVLVTGEHPAKLKDQVMTPAGVTIDGIMELEEGRLRVTLIKAVVKAAERASQLMHKPR